MPIWSIIMMQELSEFLYGYFCRILSDRTDLWFQTMSDTASISEQFVRSWERLVWDSLCGLTHGLSAMQLNVLLQFTNVDFLVVTVLYQKRLKKERRARRRLTDQLDKESKRRTQFEEALKAASSETFRAISGELTLTFGTFDNHRFVRMRSIISSRLSRLFPFSWYETFH